MKLVEIKQVPWVFQTVVKKKALNPVMDITKLLVHILEDRNRMKPAHPQIWHNKVDSKKVIITATLPRCSRNAATAKL